MIQLYTDGSCRGNGKEGAVGGYAFVILENDELVCNFSKGVENTTNNKMELLAVIEGLKYLSSYEGEIEVYTDSAYIINCLQQKWYKKWQDNGWVNSKREQVKNQDLWKQLIPWFDNEKIKFHKIKGHNGDTQNELVDCLAVSAALSLINKKENK